MKTSLHHTLKIFMLLLVSCKSVELKTMEQLGNRINVRTENESVSVGLITAPVGMALAPDKQYFWFNKGVVLSTQGGYSGKLLHGSSVVHYRMNKQMKEQGQYRYGLKEGKWLLWGPNGCLKERQSWKSGLKQGKTILYDSVGVEKAKVRYKHGLEVKQKDHKISKWLKKKLQRVFSRKQS